MRRVEAYRANRILYNFIRSNRIQGRAIVPANVCQSVVDTLHFAGMDLLFVDISYETLCADSLEVIKYAPEASLFLFVHTYGVEMDCPLWFMDVKRANPRIAIVDDCCLCLPKVNVSDSLADLVLFSFCDKKQVELGSGALGFISSECNYENWFVECNPFLINQEWSFDEDLYLEKQQHAIIQKNRLNTIYKRNLPIKIQLQDRFQHWRFNIVIPNKEEVLKAVFDVGLFASSHYRSLSDKCTVASALQSRIINLFNDFYYTEQKAIQTCIIINKLLKAQ